MSREANEQILQLADKLARSGDYSAWWDIEVELRGLGYQMARDLFDNERTREPRLRNLGSLDPGWTCDTNGPKF